MTQRVLMVDDEPRLLDAMRRSLRGRYTLETGSSGPDGLALIEQGLAAGEPFAVVVSDMMMPGMNGAEFLARARQLDGDAVQMILSGQADLTSTISAVNNGNLFRFLTKPCDNVSLTRALDDALRQHQLLLAERELIERTLSGAVEVLTELLTIASPAAGSRTNAARTLVDAVVATVPVTDTWELRLATMLGQIGCVALPGELLERYNAGWKLSPDEQELFRAHPGLARDLLRRIPRLERVAEWVGGQPLSPADLPPAGSRKPANKEPANKDEDAEETAAQDGPPDQEQPISGEFVYTAAMNFLILHEQGKGPAPAARRLRATGLYPDSVIDALFDAADRLKVPGEVHVVSAQQLRPGMVLTQDILTSTGMTLVKKGEQITSTLAIRVENFALQVGVVEPILVRVSGS
ncbi:MAG: response regulator [Actinobacteria bacterium]|nr:response regulator [Actinomycetota bacterium]